MTRSKDPMDELRHGGGAEIGSGVLPDSRWQIRALERDGSLYVKLDLCRPSGFPIRGGGAGGVGLANDQRPVVISMSGPGVEGSYWYMGQAVQHATRIELSLADGTNSHATLLRGEAIPVQLWVAFIDAGGTATRVRGFVASEMLEEIDIAEEDRSSRGTLLWGPLHA